MKILAFDCVMDGISECERSRLRAKWIEEQAKAVASLAPNEYLEREPTGLALAAAEIVAATRGHASDDLPVRIPKRGADLDALALLCLAAILRIRFQSELIDTFMGERWRLQFLDLLTDLERRLEAPAVAAPKPRRKRVVPHASGSVFQVPLPDGRYAYGRVLDEYTYAIYRDLSERPERPPIGSRDFLAVATGMYQEVHAKQICPIVGFDAWEPGEPCSEPRFVRGMYPFFATRHYKESGWRRSPIEECIGLFPSGQCDLADFVDWVMEGPGGPIEHYGLPVLPNAEGILQRMRWEDWDIAWHHSYVFEIRRNFELHRDANFQHLKYKYDYWKSKPWNRDIPEGQGLLTFSEYYGLKEY